jgi:hypothetical protein
MRALHFLFVLGLVFVTEACSVNRRESLQTTVDNYVKAIRRGDEEGILNFVKSEHSSEFYANVQKLGQIQISGLEAKTIFPDEKLESAMVTVLLEYYPQNGQSVVQSRRYLMWDFDEKAKAWFLNESTPLGKTELPRKK